MAVAQATQFSPGLTRISHCDNLGLRALSLFAVLALAKVLTLAGRDLPLSAWTPFVYLWQDLALALMVAGLEAALGRRWIGWILYGAIILYTAVNVPLVRILSSPLTWTMMRATRAALTDSIQHHLTPASLSLIGSVLIAGIGFPFVLRRMRLSAGGACGASILVALGWIGTARIETNGLHRTPVIALVRSAIPRAPNQFQHGDWRASMAENATSEDLSRLSGLAAGRHVIFIACESTGAQYLKPYGATEDPMPNLSELARQSLICENAYAVYPESIKGLFSVLCSQYPAVDTKPERYRNFGGPSIAEAMACAGYKTALFHSGRFMYLGMDSILQNRGFQTMEDAGDIGGNHNSSFGVDEPATVQRMLNWIDSLDQSERFFILYLPIAGHHPYDTPEPRPFRGNEEIQRYRNALHYADSALGQILDGLKRRGLDEQTLFVIFGDHGEAFGQHPGNYGHTLFIYEENVRVPLIIAAPGLWTESIRVHRIGSLLDIAPTVFDLLRLPQPPSCQGASLLSGRPRAALFFTDYSLALLGLRDECWKLIHDLESGRSKLFNLCDDPRERIDHAQEQPERVAKYRRQLIQWSAAQRYRVTRPREFAEHSRDQNAVD